MATTTKSRDKFLDPLSSTDKPEVLLNKLKVIGQYTLDMKPESLDKESTKQVLSLLDNLTQNSLHDTVSAHPQLLLILSCSLIDLIKILKPNNAQIQKKCEYIFSIVNETLQKTNKLTEAKYLP